MQQSKRRGWWTRKRRWQKIALVVIAVPVALFLALVIATIVDPPNHTARDATATAANSTTVANAIITATAKQQSHDILGTATTVSASATQGARNTEIARAQVAAQAATQSARNAKGTATAVPTEMPIPVPATETETNVPPIPTPTPTIVSTAMSAPTAITEPTQAPKLATATKEIKPTDTPQPQPTATSHTGFSANAGGGAVERQESHRPRR